MDNEDRYEYYEDMLPKGGLPLCGFRILSYLNDSGQTCYRMDYEGEVAISQLIGLIEMAKHDVTSGAIDVSRVRGQEEDE
jgi:hypothetical protein